MIRLERGRTCLWLPPEGGRPPHPPPAILFLHGIGGAVPAATNSPSSAAGACRSCAAGRLPSYRRPLSPSWWWRRSARPMRAGAGPPSSMRSTP
ncbi:MAG: hypothetical protein U1E38_02920 [Rhodospirillales bacterium]